MNLSRLVRESSLSDANKLRIMRLYYGWQRYVVLPVQVRVMRAELFLKGVMR